MTAVHGRHASSHRPWGEHDRAFVLRLQAEDERAGSGKREAESGKRKAGSGKREAESGKRKAGSGKREAESGKRKAGSGKREAESGKRKAGSCVFAFHRQPTSYNGHSRTDNGKKQPMTT